MINSRPSIHFPAVPLVFSVIVWIMAWTKKALDKKEGILMLILYAIYVIYICMMLGSKALL